jgi:hypothetical protein
MAAEKALEKSAPFRLRRGDRLGASHARTFYLTGSVGFRFNIRLSTAIGHLHRSAALTRIGAFLVLAADVTSSVAH